MNQGLVDWTLVAIGGVVAVAVSAGAIESSPRRPSWRWAPLAPDAAAFSFNNHNRIRGGFQ